MKLQHLNLADQKLRLDYVPEREARLYRSAPRKFRVGGIPPKHHAAAAAPEE